MRSDISYLILFTSYASLRMTTGESKGGIGVFVLLHLVSKSKRVQVKFLKLVCSQFSPLNEGVKVFDRRFSFRTSISSPRTISEV